MWSNPSPACGLSEPLSALHLYSNHLYLQGTLFSVRFYPRDISARSITEIYSKVEDSQWIWFIEFLCAKLTVKENIVTKSLSPLTKTLKTCDMCMKGASRSAQCPFTTLAFSLTSRRVSKIEPVSETMLIRAHIRKRQFINCSLQIACLNFRIFL